MIIYETHPTPTPTDGELSIVSHMAATMQDMDAAGDPVTPDNLRLRGYSSEDITRYGLKAAHLARSLSVKNVN
ncbi:hypothetical protein KQ944_08010 [Bacillus subtilis]|uniref:hypothetical protein n=1 Tax=Pseudochrobactrum asaccharolyticum TaxID=354351 RepID=UPI001F2F976A|nr:hypothetical protein [Pseudochrobactrum asaccharolyticum]MCF7645005.1 hypothetical protein [Pseudochrobactrum asaccharolyticum]MCF7671568.1 hypothetical protein [Bacillus subtilis]